VEKIPHCLSTVPLLLAHKRVLIKFQLYYSAARKRLNKLEEEGTIGYAEPYLPQKYQ
jgi:hypothetical protein